MNPRRAPQRVGQADLTNEVSHVLRNSRPIWPAAGAPAPVGADALPVPADDRLRVHDGDRSQDPWLGAIGGDEEPVVEIGQRHAPGRRPPQNVELMAEDQEFFEELRPPPDPSS